MQIFAENRRKPQNFAETRLSHLVLGVKFPGPFLAGNCAEKPIHWVPNVKGVGSEDLTQTVGKLQKIGR